MLTYGDRIKELRKKKINDTLLKREQNGYTDLDDFGTVPLPKGYKVEPWYNSKSGSFYGYDGMSENFCRVMDAHPPYVDSLEMLCGRWRDMLVNYRGDVHYMPKWCQKQLSIEELEASGVTAQWSKRWDEKNFPYDHLKPEQEKYNIQTEQGNGVYRDDNLEHTTNHTWLIVNREIFVDITATQFLFCGAFTTDVYVGKSFYFYEDLEDVRIYRNFDITQDERLWNDYQIIISYT